jgi:hypothetical protein
VEGDSELAPGEAGGQRRRAAKRFRSMRRHASDRGAASGSSVGDAALWRGATAVPHRAANPGTARGGLAAARRAPPVNAFPFLRNTKKWLSAQEKNSTRRGKSEKISEGRKSNLEHFSSLTPLPILPRF